MPWTWALLTSLPLLSSQLSLPLWHPSCAGISILKIIPSFVFIIVDCYIDIMSSHIFGIIEVIISTNKGKLLQSCRGTHRLLEINNYNFWHCFDIYHLFLDSGFAFQVKRGYVKSCAVYDLSLLKTGASFSYTYVLAFSRSQLKFFCWSKSFNFKYLSNLTHVHVHSIR